MGGKWLRGSEPVHYVYGVPYEDDHPTFAGMPCYIGAGSGERKDVHLVQARSGKYRKLPHLYEHLSAVLSRGLEIKPYVIKAGMTRDEAHALERQLIAAYGRIDVASGCLLNRSDGGGGAPNPDPAGVALRVAAMKGRPSPLRGGPADPAKVEKTAAWHRGRKRTAEVRAKMSACLKGKPKSEEHKANLAAALTGHVRSEASKAKQSASAKGKRRSPETRERMRLAALAREANKRAEKLTG